jgi:hypothetical protein
MALREALTAIRRQLAKHDGCSRFGTADFAVLEDAKRAIDGAGGAQPRRAYNAA